MKPLLIGLAPMDRVTDAAFRFIVDTYGQPDLLYTEFVSVAGLQFERPALWRRLLKHQTKTPIIAQLFGAEPDLFYQATTKILGLGFAGAARIRNALMKVNSLEEVKAILSSLPLV